MIRCARMTALAVVLLVAAISRIFAQDSYRSKSDSLRPLLEVLDKANVYASLEFTGSCDSYNFHDFPEFPQMRVPAGSKNLSALQTVSEMFRDGPAMRVTQASDGTIRIVQNDVETDILGVKIAHISFDSKPDSWDLADSAWGARLIILRTPEIKSFMETHDIELPFGGASAGSFNLSPPPKNTPHVTGSLDNVTFSESMDYILKTFPGLWIYEACPKTSARKRTVYFRFYQLRNGVVQ